MNPFVLMPLVAVGCFLLGQGAPHPDPKRQLRIGGTILIACVVAAIVMVAIAVRGAAPT